MLGYLTHFLIIKYFKEIHKFLHGDHVQIILVREIRHFVPRIMEKSKSSYLEKYTTNNPRIMEKS